MAIDAAIVVGADGARSTVARLVGAPAYRVGQYATGVVYGYWEGLETDAYHFYYNLKVSARIVPTNDGLFVCLRLHAVAEDP